LSTCKTYQLLSGTVSNYFVVACLDSETTTGSSRRIHVLSVHTEFDGERRLRGQARGWFDHVHGSRRGPTHPSEAADSQSVETELWTFQVCKV